TTDAGGVVSFAASPETCRIAVGCGAKDLRIIHSADGRRLQENHSDHAGRVTALAYAPGGEKLVSGGESGQVHLWTADLQPIGAVWQAHPGWVMGVAFSADGKQIFSVGGEGMLKCWDPARPSAPLWSRQLPCGQVSGAVFDRAGKTLLVQSANLFDLSAYAVS